MTSAAVTRTEDRTDMHHDPFLNTLVSILRAEDAQGIWEHHSDAEVLADFLVPDERETSATSASHERFLRLERFYRAVGLRIEQCTGYMSAPVVELCSDGFGRVILTTGRLVVFSRSLHDLHRFGFDDLATLAREGERTVDESIAAIEHYMEAAQG